MGRSPARALYESYAKPTLFQHMADDRVQVIASVGTTTIAGLTAIIREQLSEFEENEHGDLHRVERMQIIISTDPDSPWGGWADPQLKATWTIVDGTDDQKTWATDTTPGRGVEHSTESFALIHLIRRTGVNRSYPDYR